MHTDMFGQDTSLTTSTAQANWDAAMTGFLAHAAVTPEHLGAVLTEAPEFALGQAVKGMFTLLLGRRELDGAVADALTAARTGLEQGHATARERQFVAALEAWVAGSPSQAIAHLETVLDDAPQDPLAMKLSHALRFVLGDSVGMRSSVERVLPAYDPQHPARGFLLGCHAFALEETGDYEKAGVAGRQALWMAPDDAWGLHAVAHVHDMTCDARAGLDWLTGREAAWAHCNNFRYHVWWHKALMHLDLGQVDDVIALYDTEIRKDRTDDYRDISNATSLLVRLELEGVDVGNRWEELADLCAARTEDGCLVFADLHYMLALCADGRADATAHMLRRLHRDAETRTDEAGQRMGAPGVDAAQGLAAFGDGRYSSAFAALQNARKTLQDAGGSHAQRDVFERITIDAGLRAGRLDAVEMLLNERQAQRGGREDAYAAARRRLIVSGRSGMDTQSASAQ